MKKILLLGSILLHTFAGFAQDKNDALVYIQGDKSTPIYVKMEGEMQTRYSKHFVILDGLASGPLHLEVLFQQNTFPAQKFVLNIPESSQRSFILKQVNKTQFALYDLNSGHYIASGNKLEDDIITTDPNQELQEMLATTPPEPTAATAQEELPPFTSPVVKHKEPKKKKTEVRQAEAVAEEVEAPVEQPVPEQTAAARDERFLNFELNKGQEDVRAATARESGSRKSRRSASAERKTAKEDEPVGKTVTDCAEGMDDVHFDNFAQQLANRTDEENRLSYIMKYGKKNCFTTEQVRVVAMGFASQSSRYEVARVLKPKVVDADNYSQLLTLFNTNYLKNRFAKEVIGE